MWFVKIVTEPNWLTLSGTRAASNFAMHAFLLTLSN